MTGADAAGRRDAVPRTDGATRRRLVSAATCAHPAGDHGVAVPGRPVGPHWPALAVGVLLVAVLSGVVALVGASRAPAPVALADGDLVIGSASGARYLDLGGHLHPVLNTASARLLTRTAPRTVVVDDAVLASRPHGPVLGITGAPDDLPAPDRLLQTGWMACPHGSEVRLALESRTTARTPTPDGLPEASAPGAPAPGAPVEDGTAPVMATVVVPGPVPTRYVLVGGRRFALPPASAGALGTALRSAPAVSVAPALLDLFAPGTPLDAGSLELGPGSGSALPDGLRRPGVERVGQLVDTDGLKAVVLGDGLAPLDPFAAAVYAATAPGALGRAVPLAAGALGAIPASSRTDPAPADWPRQLPTAQVGVPCARLDLGPKGVAMTSLQLRPVEDGAGTTAEAVTTAGAGPTAGPGSAVDHQADVPPGGGALVRVGPPGSGGPTLLVDGTGTAFPVGGRIEDTLARLGYTGLAVPTVPGAWAELLPRGPTLAEDTARAGPR